MLVTVVLALTSGVDKDQASPPPPAAATAAVLNIRKSLVLVKIQGKWLHHASSRTPAHAVKLNAEAGSIARGVLHD